MATNVLNVATNRLNAIESGRFVGVCFFFLFQKRPEYCDVNIRVNCPIEKYRFGVATRNKSRWWSRIWARHPVHLGTRIARRELRDNNNGVCNSFVRGIAVRIFAKQKYRFTSAGISFRERAPRGRGFIHERPGKSFRRKVSHFSRFRICDRSSSRMRLPWKL